MPSEPATKPQARRFALPGLPAMHLRRDRLLAKLAVGLDATKRLTLVRGGPGTGKTTVLAQYVRDTTAMALWFGLTPASRDPVVFFSQLVRLFQGACPWVTGRAAEIVDTLGAGGLAHAAGLLCDELGSEPETRLVVVVDDIQVLGTESASAEALETLVRLFPEASQLVLCGRSMPPLKTAQYQIQGQIVSIDEVDLALTTPEVEDLLKASRAGPDMGGADTSGAGSSGADAGGAGTGREDADRPDTADQAERIRTWTGGWVTGVVQAVQTATVGPAEGFGRPDVLQAYLAQELATELGPQFFDALLQCAFLPRIDGPSCRLLLGPEAERFLAVLETHRTLVTRVGDAFDLYPVFRELLQHELVRTWPADRRLALFRQLAREVSREPAESVALLLRAGDWHEAEPALVAGAPALFQEGRTATVRALVEGFPPGWRQDSPWLKYLEGELARLEDRLGLAIEHFLQAEHLCESRDIGKGLGWILAGLAAAFGAQGDEARQGEYARRALAILEGGVGPVASCWNVVGMYHLVRREGPDAEAAFKRAIERYQQDGDAAGEVRVLHNLGLLHAGTGSFERAITYYVEAKRRAQAAGRLPAPMTLNNLALSLLHLGRLPEAWSVAEEGMALAERIAARRHRVFLLRTLGYLSMRQRDTARARDYFDASLAGALDLGDRPAQAYGYLGLAELAMILGEFTMARLTVEQALVAVGRSLDDPAMIEASALQAEIEFRSGSLDQAAALLEHVSRCLEGSPNPYRSFLIEGHWRQLHLARGDLARAAAHEARMQELADRFGYPPWESLAAGLPGDSPPHGAGAQATVPPPTAGLAEPPAETPARPPAANVLPPAIEVLSLGSVEVRVDGEIRSWRAGTAKVLLVLLLQHPSGASAEQILELLYADTDTGRAAVHMAVTRLRRALEPDAPKGTESRFILYQDGRYLFNRGVRHAFDVTDYREILRRARQADLPDDLRRALLEQAVALYRGPFMAEYLDVPWCELERESLRRQMQEAYDSLFALHAARDDWQAIERLAEANLRLEPLGESAYRAQIVALAMQERSDDARRLCRIASKSLRKASGTGIEPETADLFDLVRGDRLTTKAARSCLVRPS